MDDMKNYMKGFIFALTPVFACALYTAIQGTTIWNINPFGVQLPQWCDEVYYYLQIDSITEAGMPAGYMGYNESFASVGRLGAWSVFAMRPYVLLGKIFGITPINIIYFNILYVIIAFGTFYYLVRPERVECLKIAALYIAVPMITRYVLSGMTEALYLAGMIILAGFVFHFQKGGYSRKSILSCYFVITYLSLSRPYILIFLLFPLYFHVKRNWKEGLLTIGSISCLFAVIYLSYVQPRLASYYMTVIDYSLFATLKTDGIRAFIIKVCQILLSDGRLLFSYFRNNILEVLVPYQIVYFLLGVVFAISLFRLINNKNVKDEIFVINVLSAFSVIAILVAMVLLYIEYTSARHMATVAIFLMFIVAINLKPERSYLFIAIAGVLFILGWGHVKDSEIIYRLPTQRDEFHTTPLKEDAQKLKEAFSVVENADPWENTVAYEYCEENMNYCYYLPEHVGVNICTPDYLAENYPYVKSKYLMTEVDMERADLYSESGWVIVLKGKEFILYKRVKRI